jgi:rfaE bifunctional protein kinase chain/domain
MAVLVTGDIMLDKYIEGSVTRISPEAPVPVLNVTRESYRIGGSGNVAHNIAKLGQPVCLLGRMGNDAHAVILRNEIEAAGIQLKAITGEAPTITKVRIVGNHQQIVRIDYETPQDGSADIIALFNEQMENANWQIGILSDYNKGVCTAGVCRHIIETATKNGKKIIVDPKSGDWTQYAGCYLITPNFKEFQQALQTTVSNQDDAAIETLGQELRKKFNIAYLLVTRSEKGMTLLGEGMVKHIPSIAVEVYDVSGAGDTVVAAVAASLAEGYPVDEAVARANVAAGIVISKFGTYAVSKEELQQKLNELKHSA